MTTIRYDPPVEVSGHAIVVVSVVRASGCRDRGTWAFVGEKRPIAVVCRGADGESYFGVDGRRLDAEALRTLGIETSDFGGGSAA